jgi:hypothetical protein
MLVDVTDYRRRDRTSFDFLQSLLELECPSLPDQACLKERVGLAPLLRA